MRGRAASLAVAALLAACGDPDPAPDRWELLFDDLPGAILSVWGTSADDVWLVGAADATGDRPLVMHREDGAWRTLDTGDATGRLWWVFGFADGPVYMGGEGGLVLEYEDGALAPMSTPGAATIFGLWGASRDDLWAVGAASAAHGGVVWRLDGDIWIEPAGVPLADLADKAIWKLVGRGPDDIWMVGTSGLGLHWDGAAFVVEPTGVGESLFTVALDGDCFVAVGGVDVVATHCGEGWSAATPLQSGHLLTGVDCAPDRCVAVGAGGWVMIDDRADDGGWTEEAPGLGPLRDLHAVWIDPDGGLWAVGGDEVQRKGLAIHRGQPLAD